MTVIRFFSLSLPPISSHLVTIQPGPMLSDALASSPILRAEDGTALAPVGTGFEFGIDPSEDPELAMVSYQLGLGRGGSVYTADLGVWVCTVHTYGI